MDKNEQKQRSRRQQPSTVSSGSYGLAFIGALVYFIGEANSFSEGLVGIGKAILWPAFLIYRLLEFLKM